MEPTLTLTPGALTLEQLRALLGAPHRVMLDPACWPGVERAAALVAKVAAGDAPV
jgi:histidine ammonia-lyase